MTGPDPPTSIDHATTDPLVVDGVSKRYGDVIALDDVSLQVDPRTIHCLLGPNGSGKTTLFDVVLGLTQPTAGTVDRGDASVGCGFQAATFYPDLTVAENLATFASMTDGVDSTWREEITDDLGLARVADRQAGALSGGWAKRLDLALAVLARPEYVVLDEPLDDLDDVVRERVLAVLESYREAGGAILVATHRAAAFAALADHVTVLDRGEVVFDGPIAELDGSLQSVYLDHID